MTVLKMRETNTKEIAKEVEAGALETYEIP